MKRFLVEPNGDLQETPSCSCHYHVEAKNKTEAMQKLARLAARFIDNPPLLSIKGGAWRIVRPDVVCSGWSVSAGRIKDGENVMSLCEAYVASKSDIKPDVAAFEHYSQPAA